MHVEQESCLLDSLKRGRFHPENNIIKDLWIREKGRHSKRAFWERVNQSLRWCTNTNFNISSSPLPLPSNRLFLQTFNKLGCASMEKTRPNLYTNRILHVGVLRTNFVPNKYAESVVSFVATLRHF
jgi:hypothetical protein